MLPSNTDLVSSALDRNQPSKTLPVTFYSIEPFHVHCSVNSSPLEFVKILSSPRITSAPPPLIPHPAPLAGAEYCVEAGRKVLVQFCTGPALSQTSTWDSESQGTAHTIQYEIVGLGFRVGGGFLACGVIVGGAQALRCPPPLTSEATGSGRHGPPACYRVGGNLGTVRRPRSQGVWQLVI